MNNYPPKRKAAGGSNHRAAYAKSLGTKDYQNRSEKQVKYCFKKLGAMAQGYIEQLLSILGVPHKVSGNEIMMLNVKRADRNFGSFSVNRHTGAWCDFATNDKGGDVISLCAYLLSCSQHEAAQYIIQLLHLSEWEVV